MSPPDADNLERFLLPDESLYWRGAPQSPWFRLYWSDCLFLPFTLFWCWTTFQWTWVMLGLTIHAEHTRTPPLLGWGFTLFVAMFAWMGAASLYQRFVSRPLSVRQTRYGVSDRRVLILNARDKTLQSVLLRAVSQEGVVPSPTELAATFQDICQARGSQPRSLASRQTPEALPDSFFRAFRQRTESARPRGPRSLFLRLDDPKRFITLESVPDALNALAIVRLRRSALSALPEEAA